MMTDNSDPFCAEEGSGIPALEHTPHRCPADPITVREAVEILDVLRRVCHMVLDAVQPYEARREFYDTCEEVKKQALQMAEEYEASESECESL
jgi:hypothetical protein